MNIIPWHTRKTPMSKDFELDDYLSRFFGNGDFNLRNRLPEVFRTRPIPPVNIAETEDAFCITMDCPGLDQDDFQIETMGNQILISGERKWEEEKKGKEYKRVESQYGKFERSLELPPNAFTDAEHIDASYKKGILTITVPKREKTPAAKVKVKVQAD